MSLTLETLDTLIGFDTVSAKPNLNIIEFIDDFLRTRRARTMRVPSDEAGKCGLYAEIGPQAAGGVLLSAHTDVVPVDGQIWTRPAFKLTREGDRLFGRGATDMKGYVACMLTAADAASNAPLKEPLKLIFSYDEEIGCVGVQKMLTQMAPMLGAPRACFVGEPTDMQTAVGHKGKAALRAICHGQSGHSALAPKFINALHMAAEFVSGLRALQERLRLNGARDEAYDIPYSTVHVGRLSGGLALNIVPDTAELIFEYRHLAADAPEFLMAQIAHMTQEIEARFQSEWPDARIKIDRYNAYPGLHTPQEDAAAQLSKRLLDSDKTIKVAFGTEAGFFDALGVSTVVCGPGSMEGQGHKPDEYIELQQIIACDAMLSGVVKEFSA